MPKQPVSIVRSTSMSDTDTISLIERYMENPPAGSVVFDITPKVADRLLAYNDANRPRKPQKIAEYSDDMNDGLWKLTGDTVKFSDKLRLRDGQNRLRACIRSGKTFRTHVVFGIDDDTFPWMDQGKPRGGSDIFTIAGVENAAKVATIVRWLLLLETGRVKTRDSFRPAQLQDAYGEHDSALITKAVTVCSRIYAVDRSPTGLVGALYYVFHLRDADLADRFFHAWTTGHFAGQFKALGKALRIINEIKAQSSGRMHDVVRAAILVCAWNLVVSRKTGTATSFNWQTTMDFPAIAG